MQSKHRAIKHTDTVQTLEVKVVTKTAAHPHYDSSNTNALGYTIDGVEGAYLELTPGITYRFDQSNGSNSGHPLRFATAKDGAGSTAYTGSEVTTNGSPGSNGAYTQIAPTTSTPTILHYYCNVHGNMGSYAKFGTQSATDLTGFNTDDLAESSTNKYLTQTNLGQRSIGDLSDVNLTGVANNKILKYDSSTSKFIIADDGGSSSSSLTIQDEGVTSATAATTLDFRGSAVAVTGDNSATKTITISGTGGSGGQVTVQKNVSGTSPTQATDGSRTDFTISSTPASKNNLQIYIDGVYQAKTAFEINGAVVELDAAPASGAVVEIIHFTVIDANIFLQSHTATSGQTSFNAGGLIATKNDTQVYIDGVYQNKGNYSVSGSNVVLNPAPATGAVVEIVNIKASAASSGSITWDTTGIKTANFTAAAGKGYFVNTTSNTVTVSLPAGSAGDEIHFTDYASTFDTNKIIFVASSSPSQQKIQGRTTNAKSVIENAVIRLIYQDDTKGWTADNIANDPPPVTADYLIVAGGGGGGGYYRGGGGGAGGLRTSYGIGSVNAITFTSAINYTLTVGPGGTGVASGNGNQGTNSSISGTGITTISATGGGGGGKGYATAAPTTGGSGGGSGGASSNNGAAGNAGGYTPVEGYAGGTGHGSIQCGGGGGGAGAAGNDGGSGGTDGDGGDGVQSTILSYANAGTANVGEQISGSQVWYAGGGAGSAYTLGNTTIPGKGGGGHWNYAGYPTNGGDGDPNTGGGGSGGSSDNASGGAGGSGVIILRYSSTYNITNPNGGLTFSTYQETTTTTNDTNVTVFKSGSGNIQFNTV